MEQNVFDNTILSFDNNKVLKVSIGYVDISSSMQDVRQKKLSVFNSSIGSKRTNERNGNYKTEACVARERLKKRGSKDSQKLSTRS